MCVCPQITTAGITVMKPAAVTRAPVCSLNATAAAVFQSTGPVMETTTVEITAMRLMPTVPIKVSLKTSLFDKRKEVLLQTYSLIQFLGKMTSVTYLFYFVIYFCIFINFVIFILKYFKLYKLCILIVKLTVTKLTNMKTNKKN